MSAAEEIPTSKPRAKRKVGSISSADLDQPSLNVILPTNWNPTGECTVLIQIDPMDSSSLELEGSQGVVGRMETDDEGVILDLKGKQYRGRIFPGPTALVLSVVTSKQGDDSKPYLKVDAITDEFVRLQALGESMDRFQAKTDGDMEEYMVHDEEDVNRNYANSSKATSARKTDDKAFSNEANDAKKPAAKRKKASTSSSGSNKKRKPSKKK